MHTRSTVASSLDAGTVADQHIDRMRGLLRSDYALVNFLLLMNGSLVIESRNVKDCSRFHILVLDKGGGCE